MFEIIKRTFILLLSNRVNESDHTKCVSLSNQKCMTQPYLHRTEYSQEFHYYSFAVKLDRFVRSCNTLNGLSNKACVPNNTEDLSLSVHDMITGINESKSLTKRISCVYQLWNNHKCQCECKKRLAWNRICLKSCYM